MRRNIPLALFAFVLPLASAETAPSVAEILNRVGEAYKAASRYEFVADQTMPEPGNAGRVGSAHSHVAFEAGHRYRLEGRFPGMTPFDDALIVHDGSVLWFYLAKSNQYGSFPASSLTADDRGDLGDLRPEAVDYFLMSRYRSAADFAGSAKLLREESIPFGGSKVLCYVISVSGKNREDASTWWVDKKSSNVLREDGADSGIVFTMIKLDEPLSDELFKFTPPPGARKIAIQP